MVSATIPNFLKMKTKWLSVQDSGRAESTGKKKSDSLWWLGLSLLFLHRNTQALGMLFQGQTKSKPQALGPQWKDPDEDHGLRTPMGPGPR